MCIYGFINIFLFWLLFKMRLFAMISFYWWCEIIASERSCTCTFKWRAITHCHKHTHKHKRRAMMGLLGFWHPWIALLLNYFHVDDDYCTIRYAMLMLMMMMMWLKGGLCQFSYSLGDNISARFYSSIMGIALCCGCLLFQINIHLSEEQCDCALSNKIKKMKN